MSGNQTSGKEGGVQCVMTVVCMYCRGTKGEYSAS